MPAIDRIIHQPVRLRITAALAALGEGEEAEFTFLRDGLDLTDGNLGAHLEKLEAAGYVAVRKTFVRRRPRTYASLTRAGRRAFEDYVDRMKALLEAPALPRANGRGGEIEGTDPGTRVNS